MCKFTRYCNLNAPVNITSIINMNKHLTYLFLIFSLLFGQLLYGQEQNLSVVKKTFQVRGYVIESETDKPIESKNIIRTVRLTSGERGVNPVFNFPFRTTSRELSKTMTASSMLKGIIALYIFL